MTLSPGKACIARLHWMLLCAALWLAGTSSDLYAACDTSKPLACAKITTVELIEGQIPTLEEKKFAVVEPTRATTIDKGDSEEFYSELDVGELAIVAACGFECSRVTLTLWNEQRQQIGTIDEGQQVVILNGSVPVKGLYILAVAAPGCARDYCGVGVLIMRR